MIYVRDEGEKVRNGINFYPLSSTSSIGFVFRVGRSSWYVRYSKTTEKFNFTRSTIPKDQVEF